MKTFHSEYWHMISEAIGLDYDDNYDSRRFGPEKRNSAMFKEVVRNLLRRIGLLSVAEARQTTRNGIGLIGPFISELEWLYTKLSDSESREILVKTAAYRTLGHRRIRLPLNNPEHWARIQAAGKLPRSEESIDAGFMGKRLHRLALGDLGYPIELFISPGGVVTQFVEQQYRCETSEGPIECAEGDVAIDAGGCYGETALYFAYKTGERGKVVSFEFLPANLEIQQKNLQLNPSLASRIRVIEKPVWSQSGKKLFISGRGPATMVRPTSEDPNAHSVQTLRIDDLVKDGDLPRVDFIKMDIEGAELEALKGSTEVLQQFKPKLAITVYHDFRDFWTIPRFLDELGLGYRFYLRHFTIHAEETVLFAIAR
jgi:FkbM family methyltransferase